MFEGLHPKSGLGQFGNQLRKDGEEEEGASQTETHDPKNEQPEADRCLDSESADGGHERSHARRTNDCGENAHAEGTKQVIALRYFRIGTDQSSTDLKDTEQV